MGEKCPIKFYIIVNNIESAIKMEVLPITCIVSFALEVSGSSSFKGKRLHKTSVPGDGDLWGRL